MTSIYRLYSVYKVLWHLGKTSQVYLKTVAALYQNDSGIINGLLIWTTRNT